MSEYIVRVTGFPGVMKREVIGELIRCKDCIYYDPPHVEKNGERIEYSVMPEYAFDALAVGLVSAKYGVNVGGRCLRDYNVGYLEDKRVFVSETNYCGRAEVRTDGRSDQQTGGD